MSESIIDAAQGSEAWLKLRLGKATGSRISDIVAKPRSGSGPSASRETYLAQLVCERLTGAVQDGYKSAAMLRGTEVEPKARDAYSFYSGWDVQQVGFTPHPTIGMSGCSVDGVVGDDGIVEFKCPDSKEHIAALRGKPISGAYMTQMMWEMACTGRHWCDWVSFDDRLPESMCLFVKRVPRDNARIRELEIEVIKFLAEVDATVAELRARYERDNYVPLLKAG